MLVHFRSSFEVDQRKVGHTNNGEHEDEEHEEETEGSHGRRSIH